MDNRMILIEGYLASGKSTFAEQLSRQIQVPCLVKDTFKIALCSNIQVADRKEKSRFSAVTFDGMMYVAERMLWAGYPIILEGNFVPAGVKKRDESEAIRQLADRCHAAVLTYKFIGDTKVLYQRFVAREETVGRGDVNRIGSAVAFSEFHKWCHNLDPFFAGGEVIQVDTTDFGRVDWDGLTDAARRFIGR